MKGLDLGKFIISKLNILAPKVRLLRILTQFVHSINEY